MKCPACERPTLDYVRDRVTGEIVKDDGRFLLRCSFCNETIIADKKRLDGIKGLAARPSVLWWVAGALGLAATFAEYFLQLTMRYPDSWAGRLAMPAFGLMMLTALLRVLVWLLLDAREKTAKEKFENYFAFALMLMFTGFLVWMITVSVLRDRAEQRRLGGPPAARAPR